MQSGSGVLFTSPTGKTMCHQKPIEMIGHIAGDGEQQKNK